MELTYNATDIEEVLNALNKLQIVGLANAEIVTFIVQRLSNSKVSNAGENNKAGEVNGN